ncbi:MAG: ZIP family metal transporter [Planctomycetota bacterium]
MSPETALLIYGVLIVAASLGGGAIPTLLKITHRRLQLSLSLVAGFLLAVAVLHLLPHATHGISAIAAGGWALGGVLAMFLLQRFAPYHHHEAAEEPADRLEANTDAGDEIGHEPLHHAAKLNWPGVALGLTLHSLLGGVALGAAVSGDPVSSMPGGVVFLAILLHKPLDALTLVGVMRTDGLNKNAQVAANAAFSLAVPIGAAAFYFGVAGAGAAHAPAVSAGLAFSAGLFLCVALSDLLPEVHFHRHDRVPLTVALLVGVALAAGIAVGEHRLLHAGQDHVGQDHAGQDHAGHNQDEHAPPVHDHSGHNHGRPAGEADPHHGHNHP